MRQWIFKYQPQTFEEVILNDKLKPKLQNMFKTLPNMLLVGPAGGGKGSFVNAFLKTLQLDFIWLNGSDERGIDVMRDKVKGFARAAGFGKVKYVVINEMDALLSASQNLLREEMEVVEKSTRFIFMANDPSPIIPEIISRCGGIIEVINPPAKEIYKYCEKILNAEKVKFESKIVVEIIKKLYPDIRNTVLTLQNNTVNNVLQSSDTFQSESIYKEILKMMKDKDLEGIRKSLRSNAISYTVLYNYLYENVGELKSPGDAIIEIGEHLYRNSTHAIKEINFMHMVVDMIKKSVI